MRTVASFVFISLDGFYEGANGELDWPNVDAEFDDFAVRQLDEADTLGFGRATYEHMAAHWPTEQAEANDPAITSRMNGMDKLVFSKTLTDASWSATMVLRGEATDHVREIRAGSGKDLLILGSAHLTADLVKVRRITHNNECDTLLICAAFGLIPTSTRKSGRQPPSRANRCLNSSGMPRQSGPKRR